MKKGKKINLMVDTKNIIDQTTMQAIENVSHKDLSNFNGLGFDAEGDDDDESNYIGLGDMELMDPESGFLGHRESGINNVLTFTFRNATAGNKTTFLGAGWKNYSKNGAAPVGLADDGVFVSIEGGGNQLTGTGDSKCTIKDFINWCRENPTAISGFKVSATDLSNAEGQVQVGQAEAQIQNLGLTLVKQAIDGDGKPFVIRPGLAVTGDQYNTKIAVVDQPFVLDHDTEARLTVLAYCQILIDLYINNSFSRSVKMERKHSLAVKNIRRKTNRG